LFRWFGAVHPKFRTPHRAIVMQGVWAAVLIDTNTFRALFTRVVYTEWIFFAMMAASLYFLRRRASYQPVFRLPGAPLLVALFVASSLFIVVVQVMTDATESAIGLLLVLSGLPVYYLWSRRHNRG
jgi:APA family basic amino acid/polyamine antiporter